METAPQIVSTKPTLALTIDVFANKKYGRVMKPIPDKLDFGQGLYLKMDKNVGSEAQIDTFKPLFPEKLLDMNGTPLPQSYWRDIFNLKKHEVLCKDKSWGIG